MAKQGKPTGDVPKLGIGTKRVLDEPKLGVGVLDESKRKGGGGKLSRSETVTVRLDPQLRYLAELAARTHRRTLSSYIEWAIMEMLKDEPIRPVWLKGLEVSAHTIGSEAGYLWDVDEADRFAKLALRYPSLLTHEEQVLWKLIRENGFLWRGRTNNGEWSWETAEDDLVFERLREDWEKFTAVANGTADKSILPNLGKKKDGTFDNFDEDIAF